MKKKELTTVINLKSYEVEMPIIGQIDFRVLTALQNRILNTNTLDDLEKLKDQIKEDIKRGRQKVPYDVKENLIELLMNKDKKESYREHLLSKEIAKIILKADGKLEVNEADFQRIKNSLDKYTQFGRYDMEFTDRIEEAEIKLKKREIDQAEKNK